MNGVIVFHFLKVKKKLIRGWTVRRSERAEGNTVGAQHAHTIAVFNVEKSDLDIWTRFVFRHQKYRVFFLTMDTFDSRRKSHQRRLTSGLTRPGNLVTTADNKNKKKQGIRFTQFE